MTRSILAIRGVVRRSLKFVGAIALATSLFSHSWVWAQAGAPQGYRTYRLRYAAAPDVLTQLQTALGAEAAQVELLLDRDRNQILVRGPEAAHRLAGQLVETMDRSFATTSMQTPPGQDEQVKGYRVPPNELANVAKRLREQFAGQAAVRIAEDTRSSQLIVVGPPAVHQQVDALVRQLPGSELPFGGEPRRMPTVAQHSGPSYVLQNITGADLEESLRRLGGGSLRITPEQGGEVSRLSVMSQEGERDLLRVDRQTGLVQFLADEQEAWQRVVTALDQKFTPQGDATVVVPLRRADPDKIRDAMSLIRAASLQAQREEEAAAADQVTVARRVGVGERRRWRGDLVSMFIQEQGVQPAAPAGQPNQPPATGQPGDAPPQPGDVPPGAGQPGEGQPGEGQPGEEQPLDTNQGLIGDVQVEFIPELGIIVLKGRRADVERVRRIIDEIEAASDFTKPEVRLFDLEHANNEALATVLTEVYEEVYQPRLGPISITPLIKPNTILVIGRPQNVTVVEELIDKLDISVIPTARIQVFHLLHMSALDAQTQIQALYGGATQPGAAPAAAATTGLAPRVTVIADYRSNSVVVQASPRDLEEIELLINRLDVDQIPASLELRVFPLRNALASEMAGVLQNALGVQAVAATAQQGAGQGQVNQAQNVAAQQIQPSNKTVQIITIDPEGRRVVESGILSDVTVTADVNTNSLIIRAPANSMNLVVELVQKLDTLPAAEAQIKVFEIQNGDATNLAVMLQQLFGLQVTAGQRGAFTQTFGQSIGAANQLLGQTAGETSLIQLNFAVDARTNSIVATGSAGDLAVVEAILLRLDEGDLRQRKTQVYRLNNAPAQFVADALQQILAQNQQLLAQQQGQQFSLISQFEFIDSQVFVVPENISNSLLVSATPTYFDQIAQVIADLDRRPPMIMIQVVIAEVQLDNAEEFGVELGIQDSLLFDRSSSVGGLLLPGYDFVGRALGNSDSADSLATRELLAGQAYGSFSMGRSSASQGFGGLVLSASNESVSILLRALEAESRLQVLSRPQIMTMNNIPASVLVGQRVPRVSTFNNTQNGTANEVTLDEVGLSLGVIPRVSPDGLITMDIEARKSSVGPVEAGIPIGVQDGVAINSPIFNDTTAITTISARSGQTVVFSGLIEKQKSVSFRGVPVLSHIPVIGNLFRFDTESESRNELLFFMTPHIVASGEFDDVANLNQTEAQRMSWCLADVIEIHGDPGFTGGRNIWGPEPAALLPQGLQPVPGASIMERPVIEPQAVPTGDRPFIVPPAQQRENLPFLTPEPILPNPEALENPPQSSRRGQGVQVLPQEPTAAGLRQPWQPPGAPAYGPQPMPPAGQPMPNLSPVGPAGPVAPVQYQVPSGQGPSGQGPRGQGPRGQGPRGQEPWGYVPQAGLPGSMPQYR